MELGNAVFGHSRGEFSVPREDSWHAPLTVLFDALGLDGYGHKEDGGEEYQTERLEIHPYYWGDCTCGFEERWSAKDEAWCKENDHAATCYQTELRAREAQYDRESGYAEIDRAAFGPREEAGVSPLLSGFATEITDHGTGMISMVMEPRRDEAMEAWRKAHDLRQKFMEKLYTDLCKKHRRSKRWGCAVHCTCDYEKKRAAWCATDNHKQRCPIVLPNLWWHPTDFQLRWYKYPLRDSYMNQKLGLGEWQRLFRQMLDLEAPPH